MMVTVLVDDGLLLVTLEWLLLSLVMVKIQGLSSLVSSLVVSEALSGFEQLRALSDAQQLVLRHREARRRRRALLRLEALLEAEGRGFSILHLR